MLPTSWPAALKAVGEAAGVLLPAASVGAATSGVEVMRGVEEARAEDFLGVEVTRVEQEVTIEVEVEVGVGVEVSSTVLVLVGVGVWVGVGVGVVEMVTGIQFKSSGPRVPEGVTVPAEAWHEA